MKRLLLAVAASLGLGASGSAARALPIDFAYTPIPVASSPSRCLPRVSIRSSPSALGGANFPSSPSVGVVFGVGGLGAEIGGDFSLTQGEILQIAVGGAGRSAGGGEGGGGSFVVGPNNTPLVIAGRRRRVCGARGGRA
jgi:hypothetical protein